MKREHGGWVILASLAVIAAGLVFSASFRPDDPLPVTMERIELSQEKLKPSREQQLQMQFARRLERLARMVKALSADKQEEPPDTQRVAVARPRQRPTRTRPRAARARRPSEAEDPLWGIEAVRTRHEFNVWADKVLARLKANNKSSESNP